MDPAYVVTHVEEDRRHWWFRDRLAVLVAVLRPRVPPGPGRPARDHGAGLSLALERSRCGARPPAAVHHAWTLPRGGARRAQRRPRELLQHAPLSRRRADARMEAAHGGRESRPPPTLARGQPVARAGLCARASRRPACGAPVRRLAAPRRPAVMRAPSWPGREGAQVGAILAALVALVVVWLALDRRPPEWDHANHLERAVICAQDLARGDLHAVLERSSFYPPLVLCAAGLVYRLAPSDVAAAQAVVLAFLALGVGAVYVLARGLGGATAGVVAALVFATAPFVVFASLHFQLDLPLASMVALILIVLLRIEAFEHRGWSVAAGIVLGLGMLTKPSFAVYVLAPLVLAAARIRSRRAVTNLVLALLIGGALSLPWYGPRAFSLVPEITSRSFRQAAESGHPHPLTAGALTLYPRWFPTQFGFVAGLLVLLRLGVAARRPHRIPLP